MASDNHPLTLMNMPLEVRHQIFAYVSMSDTQPQKLLRYWFENKEVDEKIAAFKARYLGARVPMVVFDGDQYDDEDWEGDDDDQEAEEEQEEEEDGGGDSDLDGEDDGDAEEDEEDEEEQVEEDFDDEAAGEDDDDEGNEDGDEMGDGESDEEGDAYTATGARPTGAMHPAPFHMDRPITAHSKWRHIPQFMRITHCPPPVELLLASKQLNNEAKSWFYDVAVLRIDATGSFAHTSLFEEAFSQMTEASFSPMRHIRKVEVAFIWDTTWLRSDQAGDAGAIFPALLRQRAAFVIGILARAPNLCGVTVHWYDSAKDEESVDLMNEILIGFLGLNVDIKLKSRYIAADATPCSKSIAGRRRVGFQNLVDNGLDRLF